MRVAPVLFCLVSSLLTGCTLANNAGPAANVPSAGMAGTALGGKSPILGAAVAIYAAGTTAQGVASTTPLATTTTSLTDGSFKFAPGAYSCPYGNTPTYIVVSGGNPGSGTNANLALMAAMGPCSGASSLTLTVDEVTTAATAIALAQFMGQGLGAGVVPQIGALCSNCSGGQYNKGMVAAFNNSVPQLVSLHGYALSSGTVGSVTVTREDAKLNSIGNTLAACVNSTGQTSTTETSTPCGKLFSYTNANGASTRPADTIQAAVMMALYPQNQVPNLYSLGTSTPPYVGLTSAPTDWTIAVSYATTAMGLDLVGLNNSSIDIDSNGRVWFPSSKPGATGAGAFDPSNTTFNGPYGSGLTAPMHLAIDSQGYAWMTDALSGKVQGVSIASPSTVVSFPSNHPQGGGPILFDATGDVYYIGTDSSNAPHVYWGTTTGPINGGVAQGPMQLYASSPAIDGYVVTGMAIVGNTAGSSHVYTMSNNGSATAYFDDISSSISTKTNLFTSSQALIYQQLISGSVVSTRPGMVGLTGMQTVCVQAYFCDTADFTTLNGPEGSATDSNNTLWVANENNASFTGLNPTSNFFSARNNPAYGHGTGNGGTLTAPMGLAIDMSGNIWMSNATCDGYYYRGTCTSTNPYVLTEVFGIAGPVYTPMWNRQISNYYSARPIQ